MRRTTVVTLAALILAVSFLPVLAQTGTDDPSTAGNSDASGAPATDATTTTPATTADPAPSASTTATGDDMSSTLPQTATPWPAVARLGVLSLAAAAGLRRKAAPHRVR